MKILTTAFMLSMLIFCFSKASAQEDILVTNKGDTIHCYIHHSFYRGWDSYKVDKKDNYKEITPDNFYYYYVTDRKKGYKSSLLPGYKYRQFLELLEHGKIDLYMLVQTTYSYNAATHTRDNMTMGSYYISKKSDTLHFLETSAIFNFGKKHEKNLFTEMINDNAAVYNAFVADRRIDIKKIRRYVHFYNTGQDASQ